MVKDEKYLIDLIHYLVKFPKETEWLEFKTNYFQADEIGKRQVKTVVKSLT